MNSCLFDELNFSEDPFDLTHYILTSEIRLDLLLNLYGESKVLDEIKSDINKKPGNLLRSLNELIERKLVIKSDKRYSLSSTGYLLTMNIINLFDNWNSIDNHFDFWQKHSINSFESKFIKRIHIWENAELIESNTIEFDKTFRVYFENLHESREINMILPIFSKMYIDVVLESLIRNDATLTLITNNPILELIHENDSENTFDSLIKEDKIQVILVEDNLEMFFTSCDNFSSLFLFFDEMLFDESEMLLIKDEENIKNAKSMFNHFKCLAEWLNHYSLEHQCHCDEKPSWPTARILTACLCRPNTIPNLKIGDLSQRQQKRQMITFTIDSITFYKYFRVSTYSI